jgi:hypothetical protein
MIGTRARLLVAVIAAGTATACVNAPAVLTELLEARRLASELHVEFTKAADAANRAVMADTDEASAAAADESRRARRVVERDLEALQPILQSRGYRDEMRYLARSGRASRSTVGWTTRFCHWPSRTQI